MQAASLSFCGTGIGLNAEQDPDPANGVPPQGVVSSTTAQLDMLFFLPTKVCFSLLC